MNYHHQSFVKPRVVFCSKGLEGEVAERLLRAMTVQG